MKNVLVIMITVCLLVSVGQAEEYITNGGFETGDLTGWTAVGGGFNHTVVTSVTYGSYTITPYEGSYFDKTQIVSNTNNIEQDFGEGKQGTLVGYFNQTTTSNFPAFSIWDHGNAHTFRVLIGHTSEYLGTEIVCGMGHGGWGEMYATSYHPVMGQWHEVKFVVDDNGLDAYWDGNVIIENYAAHTSIQKISIGGDWNTTNGGYDGFSFTPGPPPTCAELIEMEHGYDVDMNNDCYVNETDLKQFIDDWLRCIDPAEAGCEEPWISGEETGAGAQAPLEVSADEVVAWADGFESGDSSGWKPGPVNPGSHSVESNMGLLLAHGATPPPPVMDVDGEPFFPLGYFDHFTNTTTSVYDARYGPYSQQGINTVLHWGSNWSSAWEWSVMAADRALAHGLQYMAQIHTFAVWGHDKANPPNPVPIEALDVLVDHLWDHPALIAWYLADEPILNGVTASWMQQVYARVQAHDLKPGDHPQLITFCRDETPYFAAEPPLTHDVTMADVYPCDTGNGGAEFSNDLHGVSIETARQIGLIQSYGNTKPQINCSQASALDDGYHTPMRLPTYREQRYLTFGPIVEGARGILWWDWGDSTDPIYVQERAEYCQNTLGPVATQIGALIPAIISNDISISVTSDHDTDTAGRGIEDVTYLLGYDGEDHYLIAVNHSNAALPSVTFTLTGTPLGLADGAEAVYNEVPYEALLDNENYAFQTRLVIREPVSGYTWTITDSFATPYDVNLYRLSAVAPPTNCTEVLGYGYSLDADFSGDCHVNIQDFCWVAQDWLNCIHPDDLLCDKPWQ